MRRLRFCTGKVWYMSVVWYPVAEAMERDRIWKQHSLICQLVWSLKYACTSDWVLFPTLHRLWISNSVILTYRYRIFIYQFSISHKIYALIRGEITFEAKTSWPIPVTALLSTSICISGCFNKILERREFSVYLVLICVSLIYERLKAAQFYLANTEEKGYFSLRFVSG